MQKKEKFCFNLKLLEMQAKVNLQLQAMEAKLNFGHSNVTSDQYKEDISVLVRN